MESNGKHMVRVAAMGDVHCAADHHGRLSPLFAQIAEAADVVLLCGDLTDYGLVEEAQVLVKELGGMPARVPTLAVLGNHDYETGHQHQIRRILHDAGVHVLDGEAIEVRGIGFAGAKGFCGGFGRGTLSSWGEAAIKAFVQEAIEESIKLESALQRLRTPHRVAMLHYAPIRGTVEGEPPEIFAFLGCSRLEEPINRNQVTAVVHGHAHKGAPEGRTTSGVPVYNVSAPVMHANYPDRPPFRVLTFPDVSDRPAEEAIPATPSRQRPVESEMHLTNT